MVPRTLLSSRSSLLLHRNVQLATRPSSFRNLLSTSLARRSISSSSPEASSSTTSTGPSATAVFYRALVPSMLHCLALGSIVYYALELVYMTLKREQQVELLGGRVKELENELEAARRGPTEAIKTAADGRIEGEKKSWWKVW
ncbi:hypothetical protein JCM3765_007661 [Sporobolomyces pararoseus]